MDLKTDFHSYSYLCEQLLPKWISNSKSKPEVRFYAPSFNFQLKFLTFTIDE